MMNFSGTVTALVAKNANVVFEDAKIIADVPNPALEGLTFEGEVQQQLLSDIEYCFAYSPNNKSRKTTKRFIQDGKWHCYFAGKYHVDDDGAFSETQIRTIQFHQVEE